MDEWIIWIISFFRNFLGLVAPIGDVIVNFLGKP